MENKQYRLDRTKFKIQTFQEADMQYDFWKEKSVKERLEAAYYLISAAFNFDINNPPRMDKSTFSSRKFSR